MKTFLLVILGFGIMTGLLLFSGTKNCTQAKTYGPTDICPADSSKKVQDFYPGQSISSMDIHVVILGTNIPTGTKFNITAKADVQACSSVKCLLREQTVTTDAYTQGAVLRKTLDELGCGGAGSGCNDAATITITSNPVLTGCTWSYSDNGAASSFTSSTGSKALTLANGTEKSMYFMLTCTPPNPPVCASLTMNSRAGQGGVSVQGTVTPNQSINLFANIVNEAGSRVSDWSATCGTFSSKEWDYATWKAPSTPGPCKISYSLNNANQGNCTGSLTVPEPIYSPTVTIEEPSPTDEVEEPSPTVEEEPPEENPSPTTPVHTSTPTVTGQICPVPNTPVVTVNCPTCAN